MTTADAAAYPVRLDVEYPEALNRWLVLVKWLLAIPHLIIVYLFGQVINILTFVAFFAILFTKRYPESLFKFAVGMERWSNNAYAYVLLLRDEYPPFSLDAGQYPVLYDVDTPQELSRWLIFVKWLLVIPNLIVLLVLAVAALVVTIIAGFAILFTGAYPRAMFEFVVGVFRWGNRTTAYINLWTDQYPPFSLK